MKISKRRLKQIIKEEIDNSSLQSKSLKDNAFEVINNLDDEQKMKIMAYINSLTGEQP